MAATEHTHSHAGYAVEHTSRISSCHLGFRFSRDSNGENCLVGVYEISVCGLNDFRSKTTTEYKFNTKSVCLVFRKIIRETPTTVDYARRSQTVYV